MTGANRLRVTAAIAAITFASLFLSSCVPGPRADGPLRMPNPHGSNSAPLEVGQLYTDAQEMLINDGGHPATITAVTLGGADPQMELVEALIAGEERAVNLVGDTGFPPSNWDLGPLTEAVGALLLPSSQQLTGSAGFTDYELVLGIRVTEPGLWKRDTVKVFYEAGGVEYVWESPAELVVCTKDYSEDGKTCPLVE